MKKLALLSFASVLALGVWAAGGEQPKAPTNRGAAMPHVYKSQNLGVRTLPVKLAFGAGASRAGALQKVRIGSAGNLLTVFNANCHQIHVNNALNTVAFIHRSDTNGAFIGSNLGQYRYDISKNGGVSFDPKQINLGPLNLSANNLDYSARYPQMMLHQKPGVNSADSLYAVFNGSWHNGGTNATWEGYCYGSALTTDSFPAIATDGRDSILGGGNSLIGTSMTRATPNRYFAMNRQFISAAGGSSTTDAQIMLKGIWDDATNKINWTYVTFPQSAQLATSSTGTTSSAMSEATISFDPSGKNGWMMFSADLDADNYFQEQPVLYRSVDSGNTWTGPIKLKLTGIPGIFTPPTLGSGATAITDLTNIFVGSTQLVVDSAGNPHIFGVVGIGDSLQTNSAGASTEYDVYPNAIKVLYDVYYDPSTTNCQWKAFGIANINALRGQYITQNSTTETAVDDNRVQVSRTDDGKKFFVLWNDTDTGIVNAINNANPGAAVSNNNHPNLFGAGIDPFNKKSTPILNFTAGDPLFGGPLNFSGVFIDTNGVRGSFYPVVAQNLFHAPGGNYNIPVVLTEIDYLHPGVIGKSSLTPSRFYYAQNINFTDADFIDPFIVSSIVLFAKDSAGAPAQDTVYVVKGKPYIKPVVTGMDVCAGTVYTNIVQYSTVPNNTDSTGFFSNNYQLIVGADTFRYTQTVVIADTAIPVIRYIKSVNNLRFTFYGDNCKNNPNKYTWDFGDGTAKSFLMNPTQHAYTGTGNKTVKLCVNNTNFNFGPDKCTTVVITVGTVGLDDVNFSNEVNVFPNPTSDMITVELPSGLYTDTKVEFYDLSGRKVSTDKVIKANSITGTFNLSDLANGNYLMKVISSEGTAQKHIIIAK
jgi:Secretion system C-terminal sorting domain/PKD domain